MLSIFTVSPYHLKVLHYDWCQYGWSNVKTSSHVDFVSQQATLSKMDKLFNLFTFIVKQKLNYSKNEAFEMNVNIKKLF